MLAGKLGPVGTRVKAVTDAVSQLTGISSQGQAVIGGLALGVAALGVAAALAAKGIFDLSVEGAKLADELTDASRVTGLSVGKLSLIKTAAAESGTSLGEFRDVATSFATKLDQVSRGELPRLAGALKSFGIDAKKGMEAPEEAVLSFGKAISSIEDPILRASVAREAFGRNGAKLVTLFDALNTTTAQSGRITEDMAKAAGALDDKLAGVSDRAADAKIQLAAITAPTIIAAIDSMANGFSTVSRWLDAIGQSSGMGALLRVAASAPGLAVIFGSIGRAFTGFGAFDGAATSRPGAGAPSRGGLLGASPISSAVRAARRTGGGGGRGGETIDRATQSLLNFIDVSSKLGRQSIPQLVETIIGAQDDVSALSQKLAVLSAGGYKTAQTMEALAKAQETLRQAQERFFKATGDALTEQLRKVSLALANAPALGASGGIPGPGGFSLPAGRFLGDETRRKFFGIGVGETFSGSIPGQLDPGAAPDPRGFGLTGLRQQFLGRNSGNGERIQGVGEQITKDFLTGVLLGQADIRRAGEQIAFFFADYFAQKMTETLQKAMAPVFDALADAVGSLFKSILGKVTGGLGGALGGVFGGLFRAGGGPVTAGVGYTVGESGREYFVPQQNGWIVNQQQAAMAAAGGGSGGMVVHMHFNIAAEGGRVDRRSLDQVAESATFGISRAQRNRGS